jgi:hypothetical protein
MVWRFTIRLRNVAELTDELIEALFAAGCTDATPASSQGSAWVGFDREADTLDAAIRSAVKDLRTVGLEVARVEIEDEELVQWQTA